MLYFEYNLLNSLFAEHLVAVLDSCVIKILIELRYELETFL